MSLLNDLSLYKQLSAASPTAIRAIRIFAQHVLKGQNVREALLKTAEILAAQSIV